ncbi:MAG: 1-acyl-sn-glycerol-3-phosphate acyltransferase [Coriobacteriales bacterium]|nr:1-acyl-sn-glycerol-3-phosphate acyltransferase [Coriobacteriales bacterium]
MAKTGISIEEHGDTSMREFPLLSKIAFWFSVWAATIFSKIYWHWSIDGNKDAWYNPRGEKGRVLIANHASMLDPVILISDLSIHGRRVRPLYKNDLDKVSFITRFFARIGAISLARGTADTKAIRRAVNAIKRGEDVLIFPEGTRVRSYKDGYPEIFGGFSVIAQMGGCDILPAGIEGTQYICPSGHGFCRPSRVYVRYGEALDVENVQGASRKEKAQKLEKLAMDTVYGLCNSIRAEHGKEPLVEITESE